MNQCLNILAQSSDYYAPFAGVMLTSLFENNKDIEHISVYLVTTDMSENNKKRFQCLSKQYKRTIKFIDAKKMDCFLTKNQVPKYHDSYAAYYKMFALSMIEDSIERLVYLDSDIIINGSLEKLITEDLDGKTLGMVIDPSPEEYKKIIKVNSRYYYNTGVIIFDVKKWNDLECEKQVVEYIKERQVIYPIADQDIVNVVFQDEISTIPLKYNFPTGALIFKEFNFFKKAYGVRNYYSEEEFIQVQKKPTVIHYLGPFGTKPWLNMNLSSQYWPAKNLWRKIYSKSLWNDFPCIQQKMSFINRIQFTLFRMLPNNLFSIIHRNCIYLIWKHKTVSLRTY